MSEQKCRIHHHTGCCRDCCDHKKPVAPQADETVAALRDACAQAVSAPVSEVSEEMSKAFCDEWNDDDVNATIILQSAKLKRCLEAALESEIATLSLVPAPEAEPTLMLPEPCAFTKDGEVCGRMQFVSNRHSPCRFLDKIHEKEPTMRCHPFTVSQLDSVESVKPFRETVDRIEAHLKDCDAHEARLIAGGADSANFFGEHTLRESIRAIIAGPVLGDKGYEETLSDD